MANRLHWISRAMRGCAIRGTAALASIACAGCGNGPLADAREGDECIASGKLAGRIYGGIEGNVDWRTPALQCEGMPRPGGAGARLRFSALLPTELGDLPLAFIIALPEIEPGAVASETPARVTVIDEDSGRFFSSADADVCWSDVTRQASVAKNVYDIRGIVYCVSALAEVNGNGGITFTELEFAGRVDWSDS